MSNYNEMIRVLDDYYRDSCYRNSLNAFDFLWVFDRGVEMYEEEGASLVDIKNYISDTLSSYYEEDEFEEYYEVEEKPDYSFDLNGEDW